MSDSIFGSLKSFKLKSHLLVMTCLMFGVQTWAQDGKIVCVPQMLTVHEGQIFELLVNVFPGSEPVSVVDYMLDYDPAVLTVLSVDMVENSPLNLNTIETKVDHSQGTILYSAFKLAKPWPDTLFSLLRIQFMTIAEASQSRLKHVMEGHPKTLLAFSGRNTLHAAPDVELQILPPVMDVSNPAVTYSNELNVVYGENQNQCTFKFTVAENTLTNLKLTDEMKGAGTMLFSNQAQVGNTYLFEIDTSVMKPGQYRVELSSAGFSRNQKFNIE